MQAKTLTIFATGGINYVQDTRLIGVDIVAVKREGTQYDKVDTSPGNRQVLYESSTGTLTFLNNFTEPPPGRINRFTLERVYVIYQ